MEFDTQDYLKKALLDTQERVRDFMNYAEQVDGGELQKFFRNYAESESRQAQKMRSYLDQQK